MELQANCKSLAITPSLTEHFTFLQVVSRGDFSIRDGNSQEPLKSFKDLASKWSSVILSRRKDVDEKPAAMWRRSQGDSMPTGYLKTFNTARSISIFWV